MTYGGAVWVGMLGAQWLSLTTGLFTLVLLSEAFLGHYRSGFAVRMQYSPFVIGLALVVACAAAVVAPGAAWAPVTLRITGWSAIALSTVGVAFHYYYGIIEKPGGHRWLLHHLMYHAPLLAPLGLAAAGAMTLVADASLRGSLLFGVFPPSRAAAIVVALALLGLMSQVAIYHYRGAFKNPAMYAPPLISLATVGIAGWRLYASSVTAGRAYDAALWIVFLLGFSGWGWHLRGLDRMMGGLYVGLANVLEGPPSMAPLLFALLAAQGIIGEKLL